MITQRNVEVSVADLPVNGFISGNFLFNDALQTEHFTVEILSFQFKMNGAKSFLVRTNDKSFNVEYLYLSSF